MNQKQEEVTRAHLRRNSPSTPKTHACMRPTPFPSFQTPRSSIERVRPADVGLPFATRAPVSCVLPTKHGVSEGHGQALYTQPRLSRSSVGANTVSGPFTFSQRRFRFASHRLAELSGLCEKKAVCARVFFWFVLSAARRILAFCSGAQGDRAAWVDIFPGAFRPADPAICRPLQRAIALTRFFSGGHADRNVRTYTCGRPASHLTLTPPGTATGPLNRGG